MCVRVAASLTGEMTVQSFAYHAHGTADSDKSCCIRGVCAMTKTLYQQFMLDDLSITCTTGMSFLFVCFFITLHVQQLPNTWTAAEIVEEL